MRIIGVFLLAINIFVVLGPSSAERGLKRPHVWGISHVTIASTDMPRSSDFYMEVLGGRAKRCDSCARPIPPDVFMVNSEQSISLSQVRPATPGDLLLSITFGTNNIPALRRYLVAQGVKCSLPPKDQADRILAVRDPEGHDLFFVEEPTRPDYRAVHVPPNDFRIIHAGFVVRDRFSTDHFYKDILGFRPYWHGGMKDDKDDWVALQVPDGTDWIEYMLNISPNADRHTLGVMNHIALGVTDIQAAKTQLLKNGWKPGEEPKLGRDGKWQLNVYDPDDTRIEFMEFTPKEKPCCSEFTGPHPKR